MKAKVSIIISAYNRQLTIGRAIESCLAQTYPNVDVVVVNDCSTDKTVEIVASYAEKDTRIRFINHDVNKGAGLARRTGVEAANGEYTCFLDSDDYLAEDYISTLMQVATDTNADIVASGWYEVGANGKKIGIGYSNRLGNKWYVKILSSMLIRSTLWNDVQYSERRLHEDTATLPKLVWHAQKVVSTDYKGYFCTYNPCSITHSASKADSAIQLAYAVKEVFEFLISKGENLRKWEFFKYLCWYKDSFAFEKDYPNEIQVLKDYLKTITTNEHNKIKHSRT